MNKLLLVGVLLAFGSTASARCLPPPRPDCVDVYDDLGTFWLEGNVTTVEGWDVYDEAKDVVDGKK